MAQLLVIKSQRGYFFQIGTFSYLCASDTIRGIANFKLSKLFDVIENLLGIEP